MNRTERKVWFVPVLHSNTTNLEGVFSVQRMRKCDNAQTYANGIARATANPKMAKTAARNSGQYEHNVEDQDTTPIIPEQPSRDAGRKMKACGKQQTEWMARIDVIVVALPKITSRALQDGWLKMPRKSVLTGNIVQALRQRYQQKSYLGHLSSTETFVESSKLATVSTALRECLKFISKMSTSQAKQFETVSELINIYVYKALTDHLNSAHKKNMHESFEMALYLEMNKNDNLRRRTIDQIQRILKHVPANDHFLPLFWKGFVECQSKWVESFFRETALSKRNVLSDNKITDIPSEVQRIIGWAIRAELAKRQKRAENGCTLSAQMAERLTKMRVFCSDIEKCMGYVSECYNFSEQVLNKGGLTLIEKEMFEWLFTLVVRIGKRFNKSSLERDAQNAIHNSLRIMKKDPYLKSLFELGMKSLHGNADDKIVAKLHDELMLKVFHAEIANDVKDYRYAKSKKMSTNNSSNVSFRTALKCASEKHKIKT
jgi:hypothetical protein